MSGPPPIPTSIKRLRGNPGKHVLPEAEPEPSGAPLKPDGMTEFESAYWDDVVEHLDCTGILTGADTATLTALVESWAEYRAALVEIRRGGITVEGRGGVTVVNPACKVRDEAHKRCMQLWREFGLTPASRSKIHAPNQVKAKTEIDSFDAGLRVAG